MTGRFQPIRVAPSVLSGLDRLKGNGQIDLKDPEQVVGKLERIGEYAAKRWVVDNWISFRIGIRVGFDSSQEELDNDGRR